MISNSENTPFPDLTLSENHYLKSGNPKLPFFGRLSKDTAEKILSHCRDGTFLLRSKFVDGIAQTILMVKTPNECKRYLLDEVNGEFVRQKERFPDLDGLLQSSKNLLYPVNKETEYLFHPAYWKDVSLRDVKDVLAASPEKSYLLHENKTIYYKSAGGQICAKELKLSEKGMWIDQERQYFSLEEFLAGQETLFSHPVLFTYLPTWKDATPEDIRKFFENSSEYEFSKPCYLFNQSGDKVYLYRIKSSGEMVITTITIEKNDFLIGAEQNQNNNYYSMNVIIALIKEKGHELLKLDEYLTLD